MTAAQHDHPARLELEAFGVGQLDVARSAVVEKHIVGCASCCDAVQQAPDDRLVRQLHDAVTQLPQAVPAAAASAGQETVNYLSPVAEAVDAPDELARHPRYRLLKLLGNGGMGAVYLAEHSVMRRLVAIKVINREYTGEPSAVQRFRREIRAAAQLHHAHIVGAYDAERAGETHFLVMEYIDGVSLDQLLARKGPLPIAQACEYVRQAALGLQYAHERGMVHRDVKPHNLIRTADGVVKVLDFGLASVVENDESNLTGTYAVVGTADYMAPEQAESSRAADARSDVYALGCTLYHLLAGRPPFTDSSTLLKLVAHREEAPPPVRALRPDVPEKLAAVLGRMMAKAPVDRFQTAAEVATALAPFADATALPRPRPKSRRWLWIATALAALCLAFLAASAAVIVVIVRMPDGKETEVTAPMGSNVDVDAKRNVTVTPPGEAPAALTEITNNIGMKLKLIKPGTFAMGSAKEEKGRHDRISDGSNEGPQHAVEITRAFYMGAYPVTKGQFAAFVRDDVYQTDAEKDGKGSSGWNLATGTWEQNPENTWRHPGFTQGEDHPVVDVSWNDATAFCAWLSKKEGKTYELPTEAEWEYACRAGTTTRFWCGDEDGSLQGNANIADVSLNEKSPFFTWAVGWDDGYASTSPVGAFKANPWGLSDMHGNVWQWCADGYRPYQEEFIKDPKGQESSYSCVLRGGCWDVAPCSCRSALRLVDGPADRAVTVGFRVVLRLPARTP
jgi:formylglycine-generating enzyme required for sulfatase activity